LEINDMTPCDAVVWGYRALPVELLSGNRSLPLAVIDEEPGGADV